MRAMAHDDRRRRSFCDLAKHQVVASRKSHRFWHNSYSLFSCYQTNRDLKFSCLVRDERLDRMVAEERENLVGIAWARCPRVDYLWFVREALEGDWPFFFRKRVIYWKGNHHLFLAKNDTSYGRIVETYPSETNVDLAFLQRGDLIQGRALYQHQFDIFCCLAKLPDELG